MSYTKEELAEQTAVREIAKEIVGDAKDYTTKQLDELFKAMKSNEEGCVEMEIYHLADTWKELGEGLYLEVL